MPKVVFDTVVFVRALLNPRSPCGRLLLSFRGRYRLVLSTPMIVEILKVLARDELVVRFQLRQTNYPEAIARLFEAMKDAETVEPTDVPSVSRDPNDDKILAAAKAAGAEYVVSEDNDLLVLGAYEGTSILTCAAFLRILDGAPGVD